MRKRTLLKAALTALALTLLAPLAAPPSVAWAQPVKPAAKRLQTLEKRVAELGKASADVPALLEAVRAMQQQISAIKRDLATGKTIKLSFKALRRRVDAVDGRLGDLELRLAALALGGGPRRSFGTVGYDGGFHLRSEDGKLKLRFNGLVQTEYEGIIAAERRELSGGRVGRHSSGFQLARARLSASGHLLDPRLGYMIGVEFGTRAERLLLDAYGEFRLHRMIGVRAGLQRIPFGRQYMLQLSGALFRDRSPVTETFYPGRDLGLLLFGDLAEGRFGRLSYQLGVFNGAKSRQTLEDDNTDFLYAARLVYEPGGRLPERESADYSDRPRVALGASVFYNLATTDAAERAGETDPAKAAALRNQDGDTEIDNVGILSVNAEVTAMWRGLSWQTEVFYRLEDPGAVAANRTFWGVYTQFGALHCSGLELAARYGFWEVQRYGDNGSTVAAGSVHEATLALSAWLFERRLRLQTAYTHRWLRDLSDLRGTSPRNDRAREHQIVVQSQIAF